MSGEYGPDFADFERRFIAADFGHTHRRPETAQDRAVRKALQFSRMYGAARDPFVANFRDVARQNRMFSTWWRDSFTIPLSPQLRTAVRQALHGPFIHWSEENA